MKAKDFPESCPLDVEPKYSAYSSWKSIYAKKPILQSGIVRVIGDGKDTNLWQSAWLNGYPLRDQPARITPSDSDLLLPAQSMLVHGSNRWDDSLTFHLEKGAALELLCRLLWVRLSFRTPIKT